MSTDVQRAAQLGHVLSLEVREFPEYDVPPKFIVTCSCGWSFGRMIRSRRTASEWGTRHLREALRVRAS